MCLGLCIDHERSFGKRGISLSGSHSPNFLRGVIFIFSYSTVQKGKGRIISRIQGRSAKAYKTTFVPLLFRTSQMLGFYIDVVQ